jgi:hypothetical protein
MGAGVVVTGPTRTDPPAERTVTLSCQFSVGTHVGIVLVSVAPAVLAL